MKLAEIKLQDRRLFDDGEHDEESMRAVPALRVALLILLPVVVACQSERDGGPYADVVRAQRGKPLEARMAVYLPMARGLQPGMGKTKHEEGQLRALIRELVAEGDLAVVEALERELDEPIQKQTLWETVSVRDPPPDVRRLLERWARAHPGEICLARFRPGGVELLLGKLEDETLHPSLRTRCARELVLSGDKSVIPRLSALADDETPVSLRSVRAGSRVPTLGEIVRECIEELERGG